MTASPSATVFNELAAEIEILPEGTASRVLYKDDQIRVVVFTFDTDQDLTEHSTPMAAIVQMVSGRILLTLDGDPVELTPGSWVHMPPRMPHSVHAIEPSVMLLSMLRASGPTRHSEGD